MGEAEYDQLLEAVDAAMKPFDISGLVGEAEDIMVVPVAANDNDAPWPHTPFPAGWTASC